ncbi:MAG: DUF4810 domain-containing protein [Gammaproteobacteria bacterium]|nr:MAG: DUF4810 domain-containing protein [Gammaproteobacteria bacterium]
MRLLSVVCLVLFTSGCASGLYDWGGYNQDLYEYYSDPSSATYFTQSLQAHINKLESSGIKPAPGLYAELGTLYLQAGDQMRALEFYSKERDAWPESVHMMNALIANLNHVNPDKSAPKE